MAILWVSWFLPIYTACHVWSICASCILPRRSIDRSLRTFSTRKSTSLACCLHLRLVADIPGLLLTSQVYCWHLSFIVDIPGLLLTSQVYCWHPRFYYWHLRFVVDMEFGNLFSCSWISTSVPRAVCRRRAGSVHFYTIRLAAENILSKNTSTCLGLRSTTELFRLLIILCPAKHLFTRHTFLLESCWVFLFYF